MNSDDTDEGELKAIYRRHFDALKRIAVTEFEIPEPAAEELAHDILIAALKKPSRITDVTAWMHGAVACAAEWYKGERGKP
jgi:DNA-directed RNA polymerase specialized sigma24 family protein